MHGETPTHGEIVYHFSGAGGAFDKEIKSPYQSPAMMAYQYAVIPVEECLAWKPYGGDYTVRELYEQSAPIYTGEVEWSSLPLVGKTMSFGSKEFCDYCQVRETCFTQATGAPF
jgi:hypothetical protein